MATVSSAMDPQNIYDDPDFLAGYATLDRQVRGLDGAAEWPALRSLLPDLQGRHVVDLGCGFGWFSRWAAEHGAASALGVDVSEQMLQQARADTHSATIEYRREDLDTLVLAPRSCDLAFSSLTLHYVHDIARLLTTIAESLTPNGALVFSVEHPILSAPTHQEFGTSTTGHRFWKLDRYLIEGQRVRTWFVDGVVKQHRTVATYINAVIDAGLVVDRIVEWGPTDEDVQARPDLVDDLHRPWFLLVSTHRPDD